MVEAVVWADWSVRRGCCRVIGHVALEAMASSAVRLLSSKGFTPERVEKMLVRQNSEALVERLEEVFVRARARVTEMESSTRSLKLGSSPEPEPEYIAARLAVKFSKACKFKETAERERLERTTRGRPVVVLSKVSEAFASKTARRKGLVAELALMLHTSALIVSVGYVSRKERLASMCAKKTSPSTTDCGWSVKAISGGAVLWPVRALR